MDDETETLHRYGTPLDPLEEDEVLTRKAITIEDQIVTDENGKRRFHGAFTGGFSAGFWNTVGSLEGWKPTSFKSSRAEKAPQRNQQKPEDFMDDEDLGEFGIAPQRVGVKTDYQIDSKNRKRKFMQPGLAAAAASGPIPGVPVLAKLLQPVIKDKIAVRILKSMGWKPGQGIGPRLTAKEKKKVRSRNKREEYILQKYADHNVEENEGNETITDRHDSHNSEEDSDDDDEITFAPDDYEPLVCRLKSDRFGLGYTSLRAGIPNKDNERKAEHFQLFGPLENLDKRNKKVSITGQAFGVGALEEEDEDIYARDDLSKYDFSLADGKQKPKVEKHIQDKHILEGFGAAQDTIQFQRPYLIELPNDFQPRNWAMRKSRFAPLPADKVRELENTVTFKRKGLGRHDLNPDQRGDILEDKPIEKPKEIPNKPSLDELQTQQRLRNERTKALLDRITSKSDNFTRGGIINTEGEEVPKADEAMKKEVEEEQKALLTKASNKTKNLVSTPTDFKPFLGNDAKQLRYEKFLEANIRDETEISTFLATIQPVELSEWDREMEKMEFIQARKLYKPLGGIMSERFVSEAVLDAEKSKTKDTNTQESKEVKKIIMKRTKEMWKPHALLCKRYNIAEPFGGALEEKEARPAKRAKLSIFEYLETSVNTKANFQTPVIIPKHIEKPKPLINNCAKVQEPIVMEIEKDNTTKELILEQPKEIMEQRAFKLPPKTDLEKRVEESRDKPASEKIELFRAIFEDSDDDDDVDGEQQKGTSGNEIEKLELPSTSKIANAAELNILRNTSPPRGIFAALFNVKNNSNDNNKNKNTKEDEQSVNHAPKSTENLNDNLKKSDFEIPTKITFKSRSERQRAEAEDKNLQVDAYGPMLPKNLKPTIPLETVDNAKTLDTRLLTLIDKHKSIKVDWVERTSGAGGTSDESSSSCNESDSDVSSSSNDTKTLKRDSKKLKKSSSKNLNKKKSKKDSKKKSKSKKKREHKDKKTKKKKKKNK